MGWEVVGELVGEDVEPAPDGDGADVLVETGAEVTVEGGEGVDEGGLGKD